MSVLELGQDMMDFVLLEMDDGNKTNWGEGLSAPE